MDLQKLANDDTMTYLQKTASIVDLFANGEMTGEEADAFATEIGISPVDLESTYHAAYPADAVEDIEKTAADEALADLQKVAEDENSTYLTKCASIADAFASAAITGEEAYAISEEMELAPSDVEAVLVAAYGEEA